MARSQSPEAEILDDSGNHTRLMVFGQIGCLFPPPPNPRNSTYRWRRACLLYHPHTGKTGSVLLPVTLMFSQVHPKQDHPP